MALVKYSESGIGVPVPYNVKPKKPPLGPEAYREFLLNPEIYEEMNKAEKKKYSEFMTKKQIDAMESRLRMSSIDRYVEAKINKLERSNIFN
jgi:hypothetical protein